MLRKNIQLRETKLAVDKFHGAKSVKESAVSRNILRLSNTNTAAYAKKHAKKVSGNNASDWPTKELSKILPFYK